MFTCFNLSANDFFGIELDKPFNLSKSKHKVSALEDYHLTLNPPLCGEYTIKTDFFGFEKAKLFLDFNKKPRKIEFYSLSFESENQFSTMLKNVKNKLNEDGYKLLFTEIDDSLAFKNNFFSGYSHDDSAVVLSYNKEPDFYSIFLTYRDKKVEGVLTPPRLIDDLSKVMKKTTTAEECLEAMKNE